MTLDFRQREGETETEAACLKKQLILYNGAQQKF